MTSLDMFRTAIESLERYCYSTDEGTECSTITGDIAQNHNADGSSYDIAFTNERGARFRLACRASQSLGLFHCSFTQYVRMLTAGCGGGKSGLVVGYTDTFDVTDLNATDAPAVREPTEVKTPDTPAASGCTKSDSGNLTAGGVTFIGRKSSGDEPGQSVTEYDTCKGGTLLIEQTCEGYHGPETLPSELKIELWECECLEGACTDGTVKTCDDPDEKHYDGKSVWEGKNEKRYYSDCVDSLTVRYVYCNPNGSFHADLLACSFNQLCADGMCGGFQCKDDKAAGVDPEGHQPPGTLTFTNPTTGETKEYTDYCVGGNAGGIKQLQCPIATTTDLKELNYLVKNHLHMVSCFEGEWCNFETDLCEPAKDPDGTSEFVCTDDSDVANDSHILGSISLFEPATGKAYTQYDGCYATVSDDFQTVESKLSQVSCNPVTGEAIYESTSCPPGEACLPKEGICGPASCEISCNTEKGLDLFTSGAIDIHTSCGGQDFYTFSSYTDTCPWYPPTTMLEYECVNGVPKKEKVICPPDYYCYSQNSIGGPGACVQCTDTDKPNSPGVASIVVDVKGQQGTDFCTTDGKLKQASCDDEGILTWSDPLPCPPSQSCAAGACH